MWEDDTRQCPECGKECNRSDMEWTYDCHGIVFRLVCMKCWESIMDNRGFDGEEYDESDECLDYDY